MDDGLEHVRRAVCRGHGQGRVTIGYRARTHCAQVEAGRAISLGLPHTMERYQTREFYDPIGFMTTSNIGTHGNATRRTVDANHPRDGRLANGSLADFKPPRRCLGPRPAIERAPCSFIARRSGRGRRISRRADACRARSCTATIPMPRPLLGGNVKVTRAGLAEPCNAICWSLTASNMSRSMTLAEAHGRFSGSSRSTGTSRITAGSLWMRCLPAWAGRRTRPAIVRHGRLAGKDGDRGRCPDMFWHCVDGQGAVTTRPLDFAVRDWARRSGTEVAARLLDRVRRQAAGRTQPRCLRDTGSTRTRHEARARALYYMQTGVRSGPIRGNEPIATRHERAFPITCMIFTGQARPNAGEDGRHLPNSARRFWTEESEDT